MERWRERYLLRCSDEDIIIIIIIISSTFAVDDNDMHAFNGRSENKPNESTNSNKTAHGLRSSTGSTK